MGSTSSWIKPKIEHSAFPGPAYRGYKESNKNLFFIGKDKTKIACMAYGEETKYTYSPIIIYSHGNATDIGHTHKYLSDLSKDLRVKIITYDYPGYGLSPGTASESECIRAIDAVYNYLILSGYDPGDIILYGSSIGTGPTVNLGQRINGLKGLVLQTPYTSACGVKSEYAEYTSDTCTSVMENPNIFRTIELIGKIKSPIMIIHGTADQVISYSHATNLFELIKNNNNKNKLVTLTGANHNDIESNFYDAIIDTLSELL